MLDVVPISAEPKYEANEWVNANDGTVERNAEDGRSEKQAGLSFDRNRLGTMSC